MNDENVFIIMDSRKHSERLHVDLYQGKKYFTPRGLVEEINMRLKK